MESDATGSDTRRQALERAATRHVAIAKAAQQGLGIDRHLYALRAAAAEASGGGEGSALGAEFFGDPLVAQSSRWRLSTSNLSAPFLNSFG